MVAAYNAPEDANDTVASFISPDEAADYAAEYGGTVERAGVVFTVGRGADHAKAKKDASDARIESAPAPVESIDDVVARAVAAALAERDAETADPSPASDSPDA